MCLRSFNLMRLCWLVLALCCWSFIGHSLSGAVGPYTIFTVPDGYLDKKAPYPSPYPFNQDWFVPIHTQQVFESSAFGRLPKGGAYLISYSDHSHCYDPASFYASNLTVRLSTTSRKADQLSATFGENVGLDETLILQSEAEVIESGGGPCDLSAGDDNWYVPQIPFFYNPRGGNLLMDIQIASTSRPFFINNDQYRRRAGVFQLGDEISTIAAYSLDAPVAEKMDTSGVVYRFIFTPTPTLTAFVRSNQFVLNWPSQPSVFKLQWSATATHTTSWQDYPMSQIHYLDSGLEFETSIPLPTLDRMRFFRLYWETPQPVVPPPAVRVVNTPESNP